MVRIGLVGILFLGTFAVPARSQSVYTWVDDDGSVHYTDDPALVPENKKLKARTTHGADIGRVPRATPASRGDPDEAPPPAPAKLEKEKASSPRSSESSGAREETWRGKFKDVRHQIERLNAQIEADRKELETVQAEIRVGADCPECSRLKNQIRDENISLAEAQKALDELDHQASREAVPREWRR